MSSPSIMSMTMKPSKLIFITPPQDSQFARPYKDIMPPFLLMDRPAQAKPTQWRASSIIYMMRTEGLYQEQSRIFSSIFKGVRMKKQSSW